MGKVIINKSRCEVSLVEQEAIDYVSTAYFEPKFVCFLGLSLVFLVFRITLKHFLEGFLVRLTKSFTKNPSRNCISWILMGNKPERVFGL